jgi:hypothetical protein
MYEYMYITHFSRFSRVLKAGHVSRTERMRSVFTVIPGIAHLRPIRMKTLQELLTYVYVDPGGDERVVYHMFVPRQVLSQER